MTLWRRRRIWIGLSWLYLLLLVAAALFYLLDRDLGTEDKVFTTVGVSAVPALAFVAAAAPLLRESESRVALSGGAALAVIAANLQLILTFGAALPLSLVLLGVAAADINRVARLRRGSLRHG